MCWCWTLITWRVIASLLGAKDISQTPTVDACGAARPSARPFVLRRAGLAGIHDYAAVWTDHISSVWEHLEMAMPMLSNMGLSGIAFCGTDIGGCLGNATDELFARWMQL